MAFSRAVLVVQLTMYGFAPISLSNDLVALQYGHQLLEKTATELPSMISCALVFAAMMVLGLGARAEKNLPLYRYGPRQPRRGAMWQRRDERECSYRKDMVAVVMWLRW